MIFVYYQYPATFTEIPASACKGEMSSRRSRSLGKRSSRGQKQPGIFESFSNLEKKAAVNDAGPIVIDLDDDDPVSFSLNYQTRVSQGARVYLINLAPYSNAFFFFSIVQVC